MSEKVKKFGYFATLAIIFALGVFLRLKLLLANPSFWDDECSLAWNVLHKNYTDFFSVLNFIQVAPPFFMIMTKFMTKMFGESDFILRLTPFIFGIASMVMFLLISIKMFNNKVTVVAGNLIFATNQALVNYASEFKQYSCDVFFTLLCFYLFVDLIKNNSLKKNIAYSLIFALSIWFSFVSIFIIAAGCLILLVKQIKELNFNLKKLLFLFLPIIISCLVYLNVYILKTFSHNISGLNTYWANSYIAKDFSNFFPLVIKDLMYLLFPAKAMLLVILAMFAGGYAILKKNAYVGAVLILTIFFECFASWLKLYPFEKRVILFLLPIVLIFISAAFELFNPKKKIKSFLILVLFSIIFIPTFIYSYGFAKTQNPSRGYYPRDMMEFMLEKIKPNEIIVVGKYSRTDFAYYSSYHKITNKVIQEKWEDDRSTFLNSLKPHKYYWFYLPFGTAPSFDNWFAQKDKKILLQIDGHGMPGKLVYIYAN